MAGRNFSRCAASTSAIVMMCGVALMQPAPALGQQQLPVPETYLLSQSGWASLGAQKYDVALSNFDRALQQNPGHLSSKAGRARALAGLGQVNNALNISGPMRNISPKYRLEHAAILLIAEKPEQALAEIDLAGAELLKGGDEATLRSQNRDFFRRANYLRGEALYLLGGYKRAGADFEAAHKLGGGASALRAIGDTYFALQNYTKAEEHYSQALEKRRHDGAAYHRRARVRFLQGDLENALSDFQEAEVYINDNREFLSQYAEALTAAGNHSAAVTVLTRLLRVSENDKAYQRVVQYHLASALIDAGRFRDAEARLAALESWPDIAVSRQFQLGRARFAGRDYVGAIRYFDNALALKKGDPKILYNRGIAWLRLNQVERALNDMSQAALIEPTDEIRDAIGRIYLSRGANEQALAFYDAAVKAHPEDPDPLIHRANAYLITGSPGAALSDAKRALKIVPNNLEASAAAARALLAQNRMSEASQYAQPLVASNSMKKEGYLLTARIAVAQGKPDKAHSLIEQARNHGADAEKLALLSGDAHAAQQNYSSALAHYEKAVTLSGNSPAAKIKRANTNFELTNFTEAVRDYSDALITYPTSYSLHYKRGQAYKMLDNCNEAIKDFDRALQLMPGDNAAMRARGRCSMNNRNIISGLRDIMRSLI